MRQEVDDEDEVEEDEDEEDDDDGACSQLPRGKVWRVDAGTKLTVGSNTRRRLDLRRKR